MNTGDPALSGAPLWVVLNPTAKRAALAQQALERACTTAGLPAPRVLTTTPDATGWSQAREALAQGARHVVVGGGDGTVREVARALAGTGVHLGILPLGTANLFAFNLGLRTRNLHVMVDRALAGAPRAVDVGWASWRPAAEGRVGAPTPDVPFLVMAGLGHDAATVGATDPATKARLGWVSYLAMGARHLFSKPLRMRLSVDNAPGRPLTTWTVLVANAGVIPGGIEVFPAARVDDGYLDCLEVPLRTPAQWASIAWAGLTHHRWEAAALRYTRARTLWAVPDEPAPLHLDGDVIGTVADLRIRVQAGGLIVRTPTAQAPT
ncbi:MAG: diacylglycerol kinase family protein [Propionibacteriaceae bacterium]|nr:diacylglycerol kinase family protein [Propionibacteriaceae bacterium]